MIRLAIVGTRLLGCEGDEERAKNRIYAAIQKLSPDVIISGGADGVDALAEEVANSLGYVEDDASLIIHRPTNDKWDGSGGYKQRNMRIARQCTHLLRLGCYQSETYGSGWTADEAERLRKTVVRHMVCGDAF